MASNERLSRVAGAARSFRAVWNALPDEARAVASEAVTDAVAALGTLRALPPGVLSAASKVVKEAVAVWLKPFSSTASKLGKLEIAAAELPGEMSTYVQHLLDELQGQPHNFGPVDVDVEEIT